MRDVTARARLLAVEVLLAEPELLGNDALEVDLYFLRDQLQGAGSREQGQRAMSNEAWMYEQMSGPLLMMEVRRLRGELEKLTARAEAAVRELDKRLTARKGPEQTRGDPA